MMEFSLVPATHSRMTARPMKANLHSIRGRLHRLVRRRGGRWAGWSVDWQARASPALAQLPAQRFLTRCKCGRSAAPTRVSR